VRFARDRQSGEAAQPLRITHLIKPKLLEHLPALAFGDADELGDIFTSVSEVHVNGRFFRESGAETPRCTACIRYELLDSDIFDGAVVVRQLCEMHFTETSFPHKTEDFYLV